MRVAKVRIVNVKYKAPNVVTLETEVSPASKIIVDLLIDAVKEVKSKGSHYTSLALVLYDKDDTGTYTSTSFESQEVFLRCLEILKLRSIKL